jgi:hypothetical protein
MRKRYFLLDEPLSSSEIPHMLLRLVKSRTSPLTSAYAPSAALASTLPPIPLPTPLAQSHASLKLSTTHSTSGAARLASLLHLHGGSSAGETAAVEARTLRRYALPDAGDADAAFAARRAACPAYAAAARALLSARAGASRLRRVDSGAGARRGYLVVGFATAVDADVSRGTVERGGGGAEVAVPVGALAGVPVPIPGLDIGVGGGAETRSEVGVRGRIKGEVVIAVAYRAITLKRRSGSRGRGGEGGEVAVGDQVYVKARHLGFAGEDYDDGEEDDGDEDEDEDDPRAETHDEFEVEDDELDLDDMDAVVEFES